MAFSPGQVLAVAAFAAILMAGPPATTASSPSGSLAANRPPQPPDTTPPALPPEITPIDRFRALLHLPAAQREAELARRNPAQREYLRARLQEFDQLAPREQALRLEALTLRHYLLPLLRADATNRITGLQAVPLAYRDLVRARLAVWDGLEASQQEAMLQSESMFAGLAFVATPDGLSAGERALFQLSAGKLQRLEADLARWRSLDPGQRHQITAQFKSFLTLTDREQQRALAGLDETRQAQAARLIERLEQLTPEQRAKSIEAFARFSALAPADQNRFLRNAARWRAMSAEERSAWRGLFAKAPPAPPGLPRTPSGDGPPPVTPAVLPPVPGRTTRPE